jgi:serine/threonine protein kinase
MNYLHERRIVFRDLVSKYPGWERGMSEGMSNSCLILYLFAFTKKPDNVSFNYVGVLKIFDFGLAKTLDDAEQTKDGLYNMTNKTGAIRYMSPENLQGRPYDLTTDVYSWAMIT